MILFVVSAIYPIMEAGLANAADTVEVTVRQQITAEISLTVASSTLVLLPAIAGLTGGTGNGSTTVNILTNNNSGYTVTLIASGTQSAMAGETQGGFVTDYNATVPETWSNTSSGQSSQFGFGITNSSLSSANSASGYGSCSSYENCFSKAPTTTPKTIVSVGTFTTSAGDDFQLKFRVHLPANANPLVPEDWYNATTTITATVN